MITLEHAAGWSALIAAAATVVGMVTLMVFFARGGRWGLANDVASIVLMLATIPVAVVVAQIEDEPPLPGIVVALAGLVGILGMLGATVSQGLLVARVRSYEQLLPWTLGAGAIVGVWYVAAGALGFGSLGPPLAILMLASGFGFIAVGYGFARGGQRHPLAAIGGVVLFLASTTFLVWLGFRLVNGDLVVPAWNA
jgi:hypothetical protein